MRDIGTRVEKTDEEMWSDVKVSKKKKQRVAGGHSHSAQQWRHCVGHLWSHPGSIPNSDLVSIWSVNKGTVILFLSICLSDENLKISNYKELITHEACRKDIRKVNSSIFGLPHRLHGVIFFFQSKAFLKINIFFC